MLKSHPLPGNIPAAQLAAGRGPDVLPSRVLHAMPWGVLVLDAEGRLTLINPFAAELLACRADEVLGRPLTQVVPPRFPPALLHALLAASSEPERGQGEFFLPYCEQWIEMSTQSDPPQVVVHWQNITRIKQEQRKYQTLAHNIPDVLMRWDADLRLCYANPALEKEMGQPLAALLGKTLPGMGALQDLAKSYTAKLQQVFETGQPTEHYEAFPTPYGLRDCYSRLTPELVDGQVQTVLAISRDITDIRQAELELRRSKELLEAVFNSSTLALHLMRSVRDAEGRIVDFEVVLANATAERLVSRPVVGRRMLADWPHTRQVGLFDHCVRTTETGQPFDMESRFDGDGLWGWYRWTGVRLDDGAMVAVENITPRRMAEQELRQAHERLQTMFQAVPVQLGFYHAGRDSQGELIDLRSAALNDASVVRISLASNASGQLMSEQLPGLRELPVWQRIREVLATGQQQRFELYHDFGPAAVWLDTVYTRLEDGLISASLDITARKQMEQVIQGSQDLMRAIFDATLDSLEVLKSVRDEAGQLVDFEWVLTNAAAHRLMKRTDLAGKRLLAEEPGMRLSGVFERLCQVVNEQQAADFEQHFPHDDTDEWFHIAAAPLGDGLVVNWQDITARKHAAAELLRLRLAQQQQLANAVLDAQEGERRLIAEGLHNGLGQLLYATQLHLNALAPTAEPAAFAQGKRKAEQLLRTAITQTRTLSHQLTPTILQDFGLAAAMQDIARDFNSAKLRLQCTVEPLAPLPPSLELALYRMAQELANNIVKHARATNAQLHLAGHNGWLELRADDNGNGFDPAQLYRKPLGLNTLQDRVKLLNGQMLINSAPGQGTHITIRVPLDALASELLPG